MLLTFPQTLMADFFTLSAALTDLMGLSSSNSPPAKSIGLSWSLMASCDKLLQDK